MYIYVTISKGFFFFLIAFFRIRNTFSHTSTVAVVEVVIDTGRQENISLPGTETRIFSRVDSINLQPPVLPRIASTEKLR